MDELREPQNERFGKETLGNLLEAVVNKGADAGIVKGYADRVITLPENFWEDKTEHGEGESNKDYVINSIWDFAGQFEGHEVNVSEEPDAEYEDPLDHPLESFLDFFEAAQLVLDACDKETEKTKRLQFGKKKSLEEIRQSVGEDAERVAEALLHAIADKVANKDTKTARLVGRLDEILEAEGHAEEIENEAPTLDPTYTTSGIGLSLDTAEAEQFEDQVEARRVELTTEVFEEITPVLKKLGLYDVISDWYEFSN